MFPGGFVIHLGSARAQVLEACQLLPFSDLSPNEAIGWVIAEPVIASDSVPPFANSAVDGFALRSSDTSRVPASLAVVEAVMAGEISTIDVAPGSAVKLMTGAPIPSGADAVCMVEMTEPDAQQEDRVIIKATLRPGENIRTAGEDVAAGSEVFPAFTQLGPVHLGVLISARVGSVRAVPPPRVGVLATGDELTSDPGPLAPGAIRDSNRPSMLARLRADGFEAVDCGTARDDPALIASAIESAATRCDALITIGGVSMGERDYIAAVLAKLGASPLIEMKIAIRPAKPFVFGALADRRLPVFGLPGNPVSSLVSYELLVRPALRKMAGHRGLDRPVLVARAPAGFSREPDGKTYFLRVKVVSTDEGLEAHPLAGQGSHQLSTLAEANALAVVPDGDGIPPGGSVKVLVLDVDRLDGEQAATWIP
jgi:molybdopterin molybdotransferase